MEENQNIEEIEKLISNTEKIGVLGSPSSTSELQMDILSHAVDKDLVGSFVYFKYKQEGTKNVALGQVNEIQLKNVWTEDSTMRGLIREKGKIDPITERQDTHNANMSIGAVFSKEDGSYTQSNFGTVPPTGTEIHLVNDKVINHLLKEYQQQLFYLGKIYGTDTYLPMWFKHFGEEGKGGAGEAYHLGIFGKTGSGKSYLARMIMCGYSQHPEMSIFVIDPQGEFSRAVNKDDSKLKKAIENEGKEVQTYDISDLVLSAGGPNWPIFRRLLEKTNFFPGLQIHHEDNRRRASRQIVKILKGEYTRKKKDDSKNSQTQLDTVLNNDNKEEEQTKSKNTNKKFKPWEASEKKAFDMVWEGLQKEDIIKKIYTSESKREDVKKTIEDENREEFYDKWKKICSLFSYTGENAIKIKDLISKATSKEEENRPVIIVNLSEEGTEIERELYEIFENRLVERLLTTLKEKSEEIYKQKGNYRINSLVIIDESHRFAPREKLEEEGEKSVKSTLIDAVRTTRKYGLGWMFISQTLSSLDLEILRQLRIYIFGFGLGWGSELRSLKEIIGGSRETIELYQNFKDPQVSNQYSFMTFGPISPLSFSGRPLFFNALKFPEEFVEKNGLIE